MTTMRLYRGMTVPAAKADQIISTIRERGLVEGQGYWQIEYYNPGRLDVLFAKSDLSLRDTRPEHRQTHRAVCACGEETGAAHYAWRHNRSREDDTAIMVEFDADCDAVAIDGRDFLYTVFQMGDPERARIVLERSFGRAVLRYAEKAWASEDHSARIAFCDLAIHDPDVVRAHLASTLVIAGRHKTIFRNAFLVKLPVDGKAITKVWLPTEPPDFPVADVSLPDVLKDAVPQR